MSDVPTPLDHAGPVHYAGFWRRFGAILVDGVVVNLAMLLINLVLPVYEKASVENLSEPGTAMGVAADFEYNALGTVILILGSWLYFALMECGPRQATIGKMALSLRVTDLDGERIGFSQATGRFFAKFLSAFILMIGFMMAGWTRRKQALHDLLAKTLLISKT